MKLRFVIQRARNAKVTANGSLRGELNSCLLVLFGVGQGDETLPPMPSDSLHKSFVSQMEPVLERCLDKLMGLRVFSDSSGKMNLSLQEANAGLALVSQFTLFGDCRRGFRPSFSGAAPASIAETLYGLAENSLKLRFDALEKGDHFVSGIFAADMQIEFVNDGPVTLILDANETGLL